MKGRIIEIVALGQPQSLIQRENTSITELIKTDLLIEELNEQLRLYNVSGQSEQLDTSEKRNIFNEGYSLGIKTRKRQLENIVQRSEQLCECYDSHEINEVEIVEICCRCKKPTT